MTDLTNEHLETPEHQFGAIIQNALRQHPTWVVDKTIDGFPEVLRLVPVPDELTDSILSQLDGQPAIAVIAEVAP